jgi:hypothetical protein
MQKVKQLFLSKRVAENAMGDHDYNPPDLRRAAREISHLLIPIEGQRHFLMSTAHKVLDRPQDLETKIIFTAAITVMQGFLLGLPIAYALGKVYNLNIIT